MIDREKILKSNKAFGLMKKAIAILNETFKNDSEVDVNVFIFQLNRANEKLQKFVVRKLERDYINEEISKMEERLKKKNEI